MVLQQETLTFLCFVTLGFAFSVVFDIFRAIRKIKKWNKVTINIQDIVYFLIVGTILLIVLINFMQMEIRLYLMLSILLGVIIYMSVIGNTVVKLFVLLFKLSGTFIDFIFMPLQIILEIFGTQIKILKKFVTNCCKKILYMVHFYCKNFSNRILPKNVKTKEVVYNDKNS